MNQFVRRKSKAKPIGRRELRRRSKMTPRQQTRVIRRLKNKARRETHDAMGEAVSKRDD